MFITIQKKPGEPTPDTRDRAVSAWMTSAAAVCGGGVLGGRVMGDGADPSGTPWYTSGLPNTATTTPRRPENGLPLCFLGVSSVFLSVSLSHCSRCHSVIDPRCFLGVSSVFILSVNLSVVYP